MVETHQQSLVCLASCTVGLGSFSLGLLHDDALFIHGAFQGLQFKQECPHNNLDQLVSTRRLDGLAAACYHSSQIADASPEHIHWLDQAVLLTGGAKAWRPSWGKARRPHRLNIKAGHRLREHRQVVQSRFRGHNDEKVCVAVQEGSKGYLDGDAGLLKVAVTTPQVAVGALLCTGNSLQLISLVAQTLLQTLHSPCHSGSACLK